MHDEAATHFMGMMDQTTLGHSFLSETFGYAPTVGWQIDPFGHSSTQAGLLSSGAGFDALYFGRIDYQDLALRRSQRRVEGVWRAGADNAGSNADVFWGLTGSYGGNYGPPEGFCFDNFCSDEPMMDDPDLEGYNVGSKVAAFAAAAYEQANEARGTHIMMTMGSDFQYENSEVWFRNLDSVIRNTNEYNDKGKIEDDPHGRFGGIKVFYSNPELYTAAKHEDDLTWEVKTDDFFPYSDCEQCFWTGYFTSRASLKRLERYGSSFLQAARQVEAVSSLGSSPPSSTMSSPNHALDSAVGVAQHHDGVSGTAKQHVADDYALRIEKGVKASASYVSDAVGRLAPGAQGLDFELCQGLNVSVCGTSQGADFDTERLVVGAYNSLSHERDAYVSVPLEEEGPYKVYDADGDEVEHDVFEADDKGVSEGSAPYVMRFRATGVKPMGGKFYTVAKAAGGGPSSAAAAAAAPKSRPAETAESRSLRGSEPPLTATRGGLTVTFTPAGAISSVAGLPVAQSWGYYTSFDSSNADLLGSSAVGVEPQPQGDYLSWTPGVPGTCLPGYLDMEGAEDRWLRDSDGQNSGAYIFRPSRKDERLNILEQSESKVTVVEGALVTEVKAEFGEWVKQTTRLYEGEDYVEVEWTVGPIPIDDGVGKELVARFDADVASADTFYTDSNGREFLERKVDYRPTWDLDVYQPIAGNYYPVNAAIYIEDDSASLTVLTDRTQGGASLEAGQVEVMVQRRLVADDSRGVGEPLNETTEGVTPYPPYGEAERRGEGVVIKGTHRIVVGKGGEGAKKARENMEDMFSPLVQLFATAPSAPAGAAAGAPAPPKGFTAMGSSKPLPPQVSMVTLSAVSSEPGTYLVRLAHQYGAGEDPELSLPADVDLSTVLPGGMEMAKFVETTLTGNQKWSDWEAKRLHWKTAAADPKPSRRERDEGMVVGLEPMEIRTFKVKIKGEKWGTEVAV